MATLARAITPADYQQIRDEIYADQHKRETQHLLPTLVNNRTVVLNEDFYRDICNKLEDMATACCGLDVYQMTAFYKHYQPHHWKSGSGSCHYLTYGFKAMLCCSIQTLGMVAFLYSIFLTMSVEAVECARGKPMEMKLLATLLSLYIAVQMFSLMKVRRTEGLYEYIAFAPPFVGTEWLYLGLYANMFALVTSIYGSFLIIYTAQEATYMVLHSIALYFIMDLDVLMVDHFDYHRVKRFMRDEFEFEEHFTEDWYDAHQGEVQFRKILGMHVQISGRKNGWGRCGTCCSVFGGICMIATTLIGGLGAIAAPITIAVCY